MNGELVLLAKVWIRKPIVKDSRDCINGRADLAFHDHKVVIDGFLERAYFNLHVGLHIELGVDLL